MTFFAQRSAPLYLLFLAAILLPLSVAAQAFRRPDLRQRADECRHQRTFADSTSDEIGQRGRPVDGCATYPAMGDRIADKRHEQRYARIDVPDLGVGSAGATVHEPRFRW